MREHARPHRDARRSRAPIERPPATPPRLVDTDPEDPSQQLDDLGTIQVGPLAVDARPSAEAAEEVATAVAENAPADVDLAVTIPHARRVEAVKDTGELYGVRTPHAGDPDLAAPEDRDGFEGAERGENWLESLSGHAAESGPAPEEEVVIVDDSDPERGHSSTESGDRPVADKGSGGPGGL